MSNNAWTHDLSLKYKQQRNRVNLIDEKISVFVRLQLKDLDQITDR
mgnify:CR=1 FL=1